MKTNFEIITREIGHVVEIEENVPIWKMPKVMGKNFHRIMDYLKTNNAECTDAPYARYLDINWEEQMSKGMIANLVGMFTKKWHFMTGMPSSVKLEGEYGIKPGFIEGQKYVKAIHKGPYQKVGETYKNMYNWIKQQGLTAAPESIEFYMNDPGKVKKEDIETVVLIPVE
nr:GyrI-like domain-containing protein [Bacteroidota bacterium]